MGLFSAIASIFSGGQKAKAAKQASGVQQDAAQSGINQILTGQTQGIDALNLGRDNAITTLNNGQSAAIPELDAQMGANNGGLSAILASLAPFLQAGQSASAAEGNLAGINGNDPQGSAIEALKNSPLFQSLMANGNNNILANASATGGLRGGNVQHSLAQFGTDTLSQVIQQQLANLGGIAGRGLSAAQAGSAATIGTGQLNNNLATGKAGILTGTATNIGNLQDTTGTSIAQLLANSGINVANLFGQKGAAQAGGILGKLAGHLEQSGGVGDFASTIASAILGMPNVGGSDAGKFAKSII